MPTGKKTGKFFDSDFIRYGNLGLEMLISVLIGTGGGYLLDRYLHTRPWLMIIGFVFGAAAGFRTLFRLMNQEKDKKD